MKTQYPASVAQLALGAIALLASGCQNHLSVRVELLSPPTVKAQPGSAASAPAPDPDAALSTTAVRRFVVDVTQLQRILENTRTRLIRVEDALREEIPADQFEAVMNGGQFDSFNKFRNSITIQKEESDALLEQALDARMVVTLRLVAELRRQEQLLLASFALLEPTLKELERTLDRGSAEYQTALDGLKREQTLARANSFGGLRVLGVHQIDPSDPLLHQVLSKYKSGGVLSSAQASVAGDSTVVFVQEMPTRIRVFEISNDPTTLTRNMLYLTDKALQASVKYASP